MQIRRKALLMWEKRDLELEAGADHADALHTVVIRVTSTRPELAASASFHTANWPTGTVTRYRSSKVSLGSSLRGTDGVSVIA